MAPSKEDMAGQYQNNSIYIFLRSRGALPGFHWGIFIPTASPLGHIWHATDNQGGWRLEHHVEIDEVPFSIGLVLCQKIGTADADKFEMCYDVLNAVGADGTPSPHTGEAFSCRVWVKDAMLALHKNRIIVLPGEADEVEAYVLAAANRGRGYGEGQQ